jgi:hypothetical protein
MDLSLESELSEREIESSRRGEGIQLLLLYEDHPDLVDRVVEVLRAAARRIEATGRLIYGSRHFDYLSDPLTMSVSGREARAADIIIIASHAKMDLPEYVRSQVALWLSMRWGIPFALSSILVRERCVDHDYLQVCSEIGSLGRLGEMAIVAIGGGGATGSALKMEIARSLAEWPREPVDSESRPILLGEAEEEGECLGRAAAAFSG